MTRHMTVNIGFTLGGDLCCLREYVNQFVESDNGKFLVGTPTMDRTFSAKDCITDPQNSTVKHGRKINFKLRIPVENYGNGERKSPTSTVGKYIDEYFRALQTRNYIDVDKLPSDEVYEKAAVRDRFLKLEAQFRPQS